MWAALLARLKLPMVSTTRAMDNGCSVSSPGNHSGKVAMIMVDVAMLVILAAALQTWARVAAVRISFGALANGSGGWGWGPLSDSGGRPGWERGESSWL